MKQIIGHKEASFHRLMAAVLTDALVPSLARAPTVLIKRYCATLKLVQHIDAVRETFLVACLIIGSATFHSNCTESIKRCAKTGNVTATPQVDRGRGRA